MSTKHTPGRFAPMMLAFFRGAGLTDYEGMPSEVYSVANRAADQFPRARFAKTCRAFLAGKPVHPRAITDAADRLLAEGEHWEGERDDWDAARMHVQRVENLRSAMAELREAASAFDEQADALGLRDADRNELFGAAIAKATGEQQ